MRRALGVPLVAAVSLLAAVPAAVTAQEPQLSAEEQAAVQAAEAWLTLLDDERYEDTWNTAAPQFQSAVTTEAWMQQARTVRQQIGASRGRELANAEHTTALPNAPPGEYVVVTYRGTFANVPEAREIVIMLKQPDENWRVAGYFVQPPGAGG